MDEVVLSNYATLKRWDGYYKTGTGNIKTIHMFASSENDSNLVKNAGVGKIDYIWSKSTDDAKVIESMDGMKASTVNIRYIRCFYINQFPHEPNIRQDDWTTAGRLYDGLLRFLEEISTRRI